MTDISDEPIVLSVDDAGKQAGVQVSVRREYLPPLDGSDDLLKEFDQWLARRVAEMLVKKYFGYRWHVVADSKQGIVYFSVPDLMGPTLRFVIRLAEYGDLTPDLIMRCGGQMLERMGLPRGPVEMGEIAEARRRMETFDFGDVKH